MKRVTYNELLKELVDLEDVKNKNKVLALKHPWRPEKSDGYDFQLQQYYWISGKPSESIITPELLCKFIDDEPLFIRYIQIGTITREQLEKNLLDLYNKSESLVIRVIDRHMQLSLYNSLAESIVKILESPWKKKDERRLWISSLELPDTNIANRLWDGSTRNDKLEDTVTDIEYLEGKEFLDRIDFIRQNEHFKF